MGDAATYEVLIFKYGTRQTSRSDVFLNYPLYGEPDAPIQMDYFFWVARNSTRTVIIDTGFSRAGGAARSRTMLIDPRDCFDAAAIDPADEPLVVVTHAHYDHIGNLAYFGRSPLLVAREEIAFWAGRYGGRAQFHHSVEDTEVDLLLRAVEEGRGTLFDDRYTVAEGIEVLRVGGHTPGQSMVTVRTREGTVLLASDAVHYYEEYERDMPFVSVANLVDMYAGFDTVRGRLDAGDVKHLITGHDPQTLARYGADSDLVPGLTSVIGAVS